MIRSLMQISLLRQTTQFFFKLEAYKDRTGPIPSVDFDITYLDDDCNLVVNFTALVGVTDDCGVADVH